MEPAIGIEGSEEGYIQENEACKSTSDFASPKQAADPVVYKLVRVDFDGRLVPATDNELMEVEDFFDYENSQILSVADVLQTPGFGFSEDDLPDKHLSGGDEDFSQYENSKDGEEQLTVNVKCDEDMMQRVAEEERHETASVLPVHPSANVDIVKPGLDQHENLSVVDNKDPVEMPAVSIFSTSGSTLHDIVKPGFDEHENFSDVDNKDPIEMPEVEILSTSGSTLHDIGTIQSGSPRDSSNIHDEVMEKELSASNAPPSLKPDFSLLSGEINLDKFTIRELQEIFRATFGRQTSVKDKQWLKRRIAMGLVNSCDIPLTSYIIKDNKLVKRVEDENCEKVDDVLVGDIRLSGDAVKDVRVDSDNKTEDAKSTGLSSLLAENDPNDDSPIDQRAVKRVRKPTKRYIEELSDLETQETDGRVIPLDKLPSDKHSEEIKDLSNSEVRPSWEVRSSAVIMRPDSLGGYGFQVPRVSRIRRCRPRKSIITLMPIRLEDEPGRDAASVDDSQLANIVGQKASEATTLPFGELPSDEEKSEKLCSEIDTAKTAEEQDPISADSSGNNSNIDFTAKGGMRRKHHRAWSLSEVVKLVDGVSRYGAGRWSEIKRISFASYSYRTSVDLKDKWRNLLKASFAVMSSDKGMSHHHQHQHQQQQQQRKPTTMPIPTPILMKVRELAEMNGQVPRNFKASSGNGGASVDEN